jgi:hypothetical protein
MKARILRIMAVLILAAAVATWAGKGANRGWTKTSVPVKTVDEVTGIEAVTYKKDFAPGIDFLGAAVVTAAVIFGISFFFSRRPNAQQA